MKTMARLIITSCIACIGISGCAFRYAEPYYGTRDPTKSFKTEGFIASMSSLGPLSFPKKKSNDWADYPPVDSLVCAPLEKKAARLKKQAQRVQQLLPNLVLGWTQDHQLYFELPTDSIFFVNSDKIRPDGYKTLEKLSQSFLDTPRLLYTFIGHTDAVGSLPSNQYLSNRRALHMQRYFVAQGLEPFQTRSKGFGELRPIATNDSPEGRTKNRRVTLVICSTI